MSRRGRKSKLTPEVQAEIVSSIQVGVYAKTAAAAAGINETTYYEWLQRGREARENGRASKYRDFLEEIETADAQAEKQHFNMIVRQAAGSRTSPGDWKAAAWILERKYPEKYGRKVAQEVSGPGGAPVQHQHEVTGMASLIDETEEEVGGDG